MDAAALLLMSDCLLTGIVPLGLLDAAVADDRRKADRRCSVDTPDGCASLSVDNWPCGCVSGMTQPLPTGAGEVDTPSRAKNREQEEVCPRLVQRFRSRCTASGKHPASQLGVRRSGVEGLVREMPLPTFVYARDHAREPRKP